MILETALTMLRLFLSTWLASLRTEEQNESVVAARKLATSVASDRGQSELDRAAVAGCLIIILFVNEVQKRFAM